MQPENHAGDSASADVLVLEWEERSHGVLSGHDQGRMRKQKHFKLAYDSEEMLAVGRPKGRHREGHSFDGFGHIFEQTRGVFVVPCVVREIEDEEAGEEANLWFEARTEVTWQS